MQPYQMDIQHCLNTWPILAELKVSFCNQIERLFVNQQAQYVLAIHKDQKVYGYGNKDGLAFDKDLSNGPEEIIELRDKRVNFVTKGRDFHMALTQNGLLFTWGKNDYGQLGNGTTQECLTPILVQIEDNDSDKFSMVRCGDWHSVALTKDGQVYCWGRNLYGQCGVGNKDDVNKPVKVIILEEMKVVRIECGGSHTLVLTNRGEVFGWGNNEFGQLGIGKDSDQTLPVRVTIAGCDTPIKQIACGQYHSLLLTTEGLVFGFGENQNGQVGCKSTSKIVYQPLLIDCLNRFRSISIYGDQSVALCQNGFCFVWGLVGENDVVTKPRQTNCSSMLTAIGDLVQKLIQIKPKLRTACDHPDSHLKCVSASLANSFNQQESSDLEFVVQGQSIHAHRSILCITSPYFRRMLSDTWSKTDLIEISDKSYSYPVYLAYLRFLYTDSIEIDPEFLPELLDLSVSYLESALIQHCVELLSLAISLDNCCQFYLLSVQYELAEFEKFVLEFIAVNQSEVYQSTGFQSMSGDQCKELVIKLGSSQVSNNNNN